MFVFEHLHITLFTYDLKEFTGCLFNVKMKGTHGLFQVPSLKHKLNYLIGIKLGMIYFSNRKHDFNQFGGLGYLHFKLLLDHAT
jgi:hypothetical protein